MIEIKVKKLLIVNVEKDISLRIYNNNLWDYFFNLFLLFL